LYGWDGGCGGKENRNTTVIEASKSEAPSAETYPMIKTIMMVVMMMIIILLLHYKHITLSLI